MTRELNVGYYIASDLGVVYKSQAKLKQMSLSQPYSWRKDRMNVTFSGQDIDISDGLWMFEVTIMFVNCGDVFY